MPTIWAAKCPAQLATKWRADIRTNHTAEQPALEDAVDAADRASFRAAVGRAVLITHLGALDAA